MIAYTIANTNARPLSAIVGDGVSEAMAGCVIKALGDQFEFVKVEHDRREPPEHLYVDYCIAFGDIDFPD